MRFYLVLILLGLAVNQAAAGVDLDIQIDSDSGSAEGSGNVKECDDGNIQINLITSNENVNINKAGGSGGGSCESGSDNKVNINMGPGVVDSESRECSDSEEDETTTACQDTTVTTKCPETTTACQETVSVPEPTTPTTTPIPICTCHACYKNNTFIQPCTFPLSFIEDKQNQDGSSFCFTLCEVACFDLYLQCSPIDAWFVACTCPGHGIKYFELGQERFTACYNCDGGKDIPTGAIPMRLATSINNV